MIFRPRFPLLETGSLRLSGSVTTSRFALLICLVCWLVLWALLVDSTGEESTGFLPSGLEPVKTGNPAPLLRLASGEWPPYTGRDLPGFGCDAQVVTEIFAAENIEVEYSFLPWARGYLLSENGVLDGAIEWADTPDHRRTHFVSNTAISEQQWVFFHRKQSTFAWTSNKDLAGLTVGLTIGYAYSDAFKPLAGIPAINFVEAADDLLNFRKLLAGRIDVFPMEKEVGLRLLRNHFTAEERAQLVIHPVPLTAFRAHLLLSKTVPGNAQKMALFNRGIEQLAENGRLLQILNRCLADARN